jgi:hypothetical protein
LVDPAGNSSQSHDVVQRAVGAVSAIKVGLYHHTGELGANTRYEILNVTRQYPFQGVVSLDRNHGSPQDVGGLDDEDSVPWTINKWIKGKHDFTVRFTRNNGVQSGKQSNRFPELLNLFEYAVSLTAREGDEKRLALD